MVITDDINLFIHNYTCNLLKSKKNSQLWQFSVSTGNSDNYKKEQYEIKKGNPSYWSKPQNFSKYNEKINILLVTNIKNTDVYIISDYNKKINRPWWKDNFNFNNKEIIKLDIIGKLNYGVKDICSFCNYKKFSVANKFQPIKKVSYYEFINNLIKFNN